MSLPLLGGGSGAGQIGAGPIAGTNAAAFLARTTGLDTTHRNAYVDFINGLDTDSLFTKFDVLYLWATQDITTALLNLVSSSFNGTSNGSPTFTADRGFTGTEASTTKYIDTGFNATVGTPQFTQNTAHISEWNITNFESASGAVGLLGTGSTAFTFMLARYTDHAAHICVNVTPVLNNQVVAVADSTGHFIGSRTTSNNVEGYKNGSVILTGSTGTSTALVNRNFYGLALNNVGTPLGVGRQVSAISIGGTLSSTDATNFYNRLRTFMTVVGVP